MPAWSSCIALHFCFPSLGVGDKLQKAKASSIPANPIVFTGFVHVQLLASIEKLCQERLLLGIEVLGPSLHANEVQNLPKPTHLICVSFYFSLQLSILSGSQFLRGNSTR